MILCGSARGAEDMIVSRRDKILLNGWVVAVEGGSMNVSRASLGIESFLVKSKVWQKVRGSATQTVELLAEFCLRAL